MDLEQRDHSSPGPKGVLILAFTIWCLLQLEIYFKFIFIISHMKTIAEHHLLKFCPFPTDRQWSTPTLFLKFILVIFGTWLFHTHFRIGFSGYTHQRISYWEFIGVSLNLYFTLRRIDILTTVNLHGVYFFHLLDLLQIPSIKFCYFIMKVLDMFSQIDFRIFDMFRFL